MLGKPRDEVAAGQTGDNGGPSGEPERGLLPWPPVAAGLLALLAVLLGVGLVANGALRPTAAAPTPATSAAQQGPTAVPSQAVVVAASPTTAAPVAAGSPPVAQPAGTSVPATSVLPPVPRPLAAVSPSVASPSPVPTVDPELVAEVGKAFERYWDVRAQALFDLDASHLSEAMAGEHLQGAQTRIDELRAEGKAIKTEVENSYIVTEANADTAQVDDTYVSSSIYVDAVTHTPLSDSIPDTLRVVYELKRLDGTWKVVDSARSE